MPWPSDHRAVVAEIEFLIEKHGVRETSFVDDTFTVKRSRIYEIFDLTRKRGLKFPWSCMSRVNTVDEELLRYTLLKASEIAYRKQLLGRLRPGVSVPSRPSTGRRLAQLVFCIDVRPEWGLAGNASFIAAPRDLTDPFHAPSRFWTMPGRDLPDVIFTPI